MASIDMVPKSFQDTHKRAMWGRSRKMAIFAFCAECMGWETNAQRGKGNTKGNARETWLER